MEDSSEDIDRKFANAYCDDEIEAEDKDEAYKIFCKKHNFNEKDAEFVSYSEVEND
jgi:hypothetical protein